MSSTIRNCSLVFFASLLFHVAGTWSLPLLDRDEPRFAEASREMRERGDYVVPYFNNNYRFDKPPFIYWLQVASYDLFGENEFAARLPSVIGAALTAAMLFLWGRRIGGDRVGWWAAIIFTLCLQTFVHAKAAVADMWLVVFVTLANWAAFELLRDSLGRPDSENERPKKIWSLVFFAALGFAFLAKGPLGWLPLVTVACTKFFLPKTKLNQRFDFLPGLCLMLGLVLAWGIPALQRTHGEFLRIGLGRHVVQRSFGTLEGHGANSLPAYLATLPFYFVTVFLSFFPWSIKLPALVKRLWRERDAIDKFLITGTAIIFVLMTLVKTKLPHYTLTAFPLMALLLARHLFEISSPRFATRAATWSAAVFLCAALIVFPIFARVFPTNQLFAQVRGKLGPHTEFAGIDYVEPSLVWYFRGVTHKWFQGLDEAHVFPYMETDGARVLIMPTKTAALFYSRVPPEWSVYHAHGFQLVKGIRADLTMFYKPDSPQRPGFFDDPSE